MHVNIKRLLSFLVVLAMLLSMTPVTGIPAIEAKAETTETTTEETVATSATADLALDSESKALCAHCGEEVVWTAIANGASIGTLSTTDTLHYFLSEDNTSTGDFVTFKAAASVCLHLNGYNLNTAGGVIVQSGGTLNILGNGTVKRTTSGWLLQIWTATANIYGGTYQTTPSAYDVAAANEAKVAKLGNGNEVTLYNNATLDGEVVFSTSKKLTLAEGWTGSIGKLEAADAMWTTDGEAILGARLAVTGELTGSIICDMHHMELKDGLLTKGAEVVFDASAETNYCEHCAKYVTWTALNAGENADGSANHYYVAADMTSKASAQLITGVNYKSSGTTYNSVCLHLNGKTLTTGSTGSAAIYCSNGTIINIMGDGTVINGGTGMLFEAYTATVNLYGGTYISNNGKQTMWTAGANSKIHLYNDAKLEGWVEVKAGSVTLNNSASIEGLNFTDGGTGTVTAAEGWTGYLKNTDGKYLELVDGAWTAVTKTAEWGVFDPKACDGLAYCEHCGEEAGAQTWTALEGNNRIGAISDGKHYHYYLSGDLNAGAYTQVLSMSGGTSVCLNLNGYDITSAGRMLATGGGTLAIMGDGNVTMTGARTTDSEDYRIATIQATTSGGVYIYGGTYSVSGNALTEGRPTVVAANKLYIKDATINGWMDLRSGTTTFYGKTSADEVRITTYINDSDATVNSSGKLVIDKDWTGNATLTVRDDIFANGVLAAANGAATGDFTGTLTCNGTQLFNVDGTLMADTTFDPDAATNYCRACGEFVAWEELPETVPTIGTEGACLHYYVPADMTSAGEKNAFLFVADSNGDTTNVAPKVCLYLNNKTLTLTQYLYAGHSGVVNVIGDGTLTTTNSTLITPYTSTVNLYGGTYIAKTGGKALTMGGSGAKVNLYGDAELQGEAAVSQGALTVYDQAVLTNLNITGGLTTFKSGWSGSAVVNAAESLITDNTINVANAKVEDGATGTISSVSGFAASVKDNAIVLNNPDPDVFNPDAYNGYAYCPDCGNLVEWTDFNAYVEANGNSLYVDGIVDIVHFYLTGDMTYTDQLLATYETVIINLNGYDITPVAKDSETAITATYVFSSTQGMILLNTAEEMSTVTGWQTAAGNATVLHMGGGGASSWARLYDNVTLTTHEDCTTDAPVVHVGSNGGKLYMKGAIIDASKKTNSLYPTAVYVQGRPVNDDGKACFGEFYLSGGTILGGTSNSAGGSVQIGSRSNDTVFLDGAKFYMTGGTISGGNANTGGNILINKNAAEAKISGGTITAGTAKHGGNISSSYCDVTIGGTAVISDGTAEAGEGSFGGGGNIYFGQGTLTVEGGTISGGKVYTAAGSGGNIYLDKQAPDGAAAGTEVAPTNFIMTDGAITGGYVQDSQHDQNFGGNIRAYNVSTVSVTGGSITGGTGCSEQRANTANMYISYSDAHVTNGWPANVTFGGDANIDGNVYINGAPNLVLTGAPVIAGGTYGLSYNNEKVQPDISNLTAGAQIELSEMTVNVPLTAACDNIEDVKGYISVIETGPTLSVVNNQLILTGVAIVNGEAITWYADNEAAVAAYTYADGKYIQLGLDTALELTGGEYLIDLAGNVAGEVAITGTGTAHLFDSANLDFDGFRTVTVADTVTLAERDHTVIVDEEAVRFIIVTDAEGKTSAHALAMAITDVNLRTDAAGLYYGAQYMCDETLAGLVSAYGVILSLDDMPGAVMDGTDHRTELTGLVPGTYATSSSVFGIFKDGRAAAKNAEFGKMKIYVNAYIQLDLDADGVADVLVADNENAGNTAGNAWSLYDVMLTIDQNWADYADDQDAVKAFYDQWFDLGMSEYADDFTNIDVKIDVEGGEGEGVTPEDTDVDVPTE